MMDCHLVAECPLRCSWPATPTLCGDHWMLGLNPVLASQRGLPWYVASLNLLPSLLILLACVAVFRRLRRCLMHLGPVDQRARIPTQRALPFGLCRAPHCKLVLVRSSNPPRSALLVLPAHPTYLVPPVQPLGNRELLFSSNQSLLTCALSLMLQLPQFLRDSNPTFPCTLIDQWLILQPQPALPARLKATPNSSPVAWCC